MHPAAYAWPWPCVLAARSLCPNPRDAHAIQPPLPAARRRSRLSRRPGDPRGPWRSAPPVPSFRHLLFQRRVCNYKPRTPSTFGDKRISFLDAEPPDAVGGWKKCLRYDARVALGLRDFLQTNKTAHGVARLSARSKPVLHAFGIQLNLCRLLEWVVRPDQFHHAPVARLTALNYHHPIKRLLFLPNPCKANRQHKYTPPELLILSCQPDFEQCQFPRPRTCYIYKACLFPS